MSVLDGILKKILLDGPETISVDHTTDAIDIDGREDEFAVQLDYDGGVSVNMKLFLQGSVDGVTFVDITSAQNITDATGTHIWDVAGTGTSFLKVRIEVIAGSIDVQQILYSAKRRH